MDLDKLWIVTYNNNLISLIQGQETKLIMVLMSLATDLWVNLFLNKNLIKLITEVIQWEKKWIKLKPNSNKVSLSKKLNLIYNFKVI